MAGRGKIPVRKRAISGASRFGTRAGKLLIPSRKAHDLLGRRMLGEEGMRAGRKAVGAGLEDGDEIARFGPRRHDVVGEAVERRAQAADDADLLLRLGPKAAGARPREHAAG